MRILLCHNPPRRLNSMVKILFYIAEEKKPLTFCRARLPETFMLIRNRLEMSAESWLHSDFSATRKTTKIIFFCLQTRTMQSINCLRKLMASIRLRDECWCVIEITVNKLFQPDKMLGSGGIEINFSFKKKKKSPRVGTNADC